MMSRNEHDLPIKPDLGKVRQLLQEGPVTVHNGGFSFNGIPPLVAAVMWLGDPSDLLELLFELGADINSVEVRVER